MTKQRTAKSKATTPPSHRRTPSRMAKAGLDRYLIDRMVCPIGTSGISSKLPAAIAAATAAELLVYDELVKNGQKPVQFSPREVKINDG